MRSPEADGMTHERRGDWGMQVGQVTGPGRSEREDPVSAGAEDHEHSKHEEPDGISREGEGLAESG